MESFLFRIGFVVLLIVSSSMSFAGEFSSKISSIPVDIKKMMVGHSWHKGCPVGFDRLAYLRLAYWGFDNRVHMGELIVYRPIAKETVDIFKELFDIHFQIERMQLPENLPKGMSNSDADNTSGFYCRADDQNPKELSKHSYGLAIDINDLYNPAIEGKKVDPEAGRKYLDRHLNHPGMLKEAEKPFLIFTHHGWYWGGFFKEVDYQHFEKLYIKHYVVNEMEYLTPENQLTYEN